MTPASLTIHYLSERIIVTPFHVINTLTRDPLYAHSDIAALNRGLFESAVNACFLISEDTDLRFRKFYLSSVQQEHHLQESMKKWINSDDSFIKSVAEKQFEIKNSTTDSIAEKLKIYLVTLGHFLIYGSVVKL